jgi:4-azaleucine resistance transporter AzlC
MDRFSPESFRLGMIEGMPAVFASVVFGIAVGVFAAQSGLSEPVQIALNILVCAGTAEFASIALWKSPLPWAAILLAAVAVNSRFLLMGAAMYDVFRNTPRWRAYFTLWFLYDGLWVNVMRRHAEGKADGGYLLGGGLLMYVCWQFSTYAGYRLGQLVENPAAYGLDFCMAAFLSNLAAALYRKRSDLLPFAVAALVSVLVHRFVSAELNIIAGALSGSLVALVRKPDVA